MSRPRTPTKVLRLRGAFKKHPEREKERANEPEPTGPLGEPPSHLNEAQLARWNEIAAWCSWLTVADRYAVERVAKLMTKDRDGTIGVAEAQRLDALLSKLGMTPSDRSKVKVPEPKKKANPFGAIA